MLIMISGNMRKEMSKCLGCERPVYHLLCESCNNKVKRGECLTNSWLIKMLNKYYDRE